MKEKVGERIEPRIVDGRFWRPEKFLTGKRNQEERKKIYIPYYISGISVSKISKIYKLYIYLKYIIWYFQTVTRFDCWDAQPKTDPKRSIVVTRLKKISVKKYIYPRKKRGRRKKKYTREVTGNSVVWSPEVETSSKKKIFF